MRWVYAIWFLRKAGSPVVVRVAVFVLLIFSATYYISFIDVTRNAVNSSGSFLDMPGFFYNSFMATDILSQLFTLAILIGAGFLFADFFGLFKKEEIGVAGIRK